MAKEGFKVTYATMSADNEQLHAAFDEAIEQVEEQFGQTWPIYIGGEARESAETFADVSPINTDVVLGHFQKGSRQDTADAIAAARAAREEWRNTPWQERCEILDRAADLMSENRYELSALLTYEMGKSRVEALGDVEESADLIRYYTHQMRENDGYEHAMGQLSPKDRNMNVLRPHGVWAVIVPFNFPMALAAGPVGAALVTGNTVVLKPSSDTPWTGLKLYETLVEAGVPGGVINLVAGPGSTVGRELVENEDVDGITFTGSYAVGFNQVYQNFSTEYPKPTVVEMGGKNAAIVTAKADLDKAATGVMRSAFGMGGQKCSACSRVYVDGRVKDEFLEKLVAKTKDIKIGNPLDRDVFLGPLVHAKAFQDFQNFAAKAKQDGKVIAGGNVVTDGEMAKGYYVEPTIFEDVSEDHELVREELFVPILYVAEVDSLQEALEKANDVKYGLTGGLYSEDDAEIEAFFDKIEAGVVYVNREAGATTGAWPGVQPFGGWKASGSTGKNIGGLYTLQAYVREQSRTVVE
ncbi:MAG: 1-pyrroline-5-carboxylate dehydrogenase 1 [Anaerolineales bacterium]|nr:1-pyrroline-5-carboxylate dehydrogenase 1 [Anaerolineales bacterium]